MLGVGPCAMSMRTVEPQLRVWKSLMSSSKTPYDAVGEPEPHAGGAVSKALETSKARRWFSS